MVPGRNDLCPCGSGKKYKKCCLLKEDALSLSQHRLRRTADQVPSVLLAYAKKLHGEGGIFEAWEDFWAGEPPEAFYAGNIYMSLFIPWFMYHWYPDDEEGLNPDLRFPCEHTVVAQFLKKQGYTVDAYTRRYLEAARQEPLSFWQAEAVEPGRGLLVKDLALERECFVHEVRGSKIIKKWDILLGQVVGLDGEYLLGANGPYLLPARKFRPFLAEYFEAKKPFLRTPADLLEIDIDLLDVYHDCVAELLHPTPPQLSNTDGEELVFTTSRYEFSPQDRAQVIERLSAMKGFERSTAQPDEVEFAWVVHEEGSMLGSTLKGRVIVGAEQLSLECNSKARDEKLRGMVEMELGVLLVYTGTAEKALADLPRPAGPPEPLDLSTLPEEERARLAEMIEEQYLRWAEVQIPALDHQTPREAVQSPEGRRRVAELINDWENLQANQPAPQISFDFNRLRAALGLELE
jgi:hypothetical protein